MSFSVKIENATVGEAHAALHEAYAPESIKQFLREGIAGLATVNGEDVIVSLSAYGHLCQGEGSHDVSDAKIEVAKGDAQARPVPLKQDGPTVAEFVAAGYKASNYPPAGYAPKSTEEEIAAAVQAQAEADSKKDAQ